jgi:hypothetical protein
MYSPCFANAGGVTGFTTVTQYCDVLQSAHGHFAALSWSINYSCVSLNWLGTTRMIALPTGPVTSAAEELLLARTSSTCSY